VFDANAYLASRVGPLLDKPREPFHHNAMAPTSAMSSSAMCNW
jgi:hypothetical protein